MRVLRTYPERDLAAVSSHRHGNITDLLFGPPDSFSLDDLKDAGYDRRAAENQIGPVVRYLTIEQLVDLWNSAGGPL